MLKNRDIEKQITNYLAGECSPADELVVSGLIQTDPRYKTTFNELKQLWDNAALHSYTDTYDIHLAWERVNDHMNRKPLHIVHRSSVFTPFIKRVLKYTAGIAAVLLLGFAVQKIFFVNKPLRTFASGTSVPSPLTLSDGSEIILNAVSQVKYPEKFGSHSREVYFWGEAFFEIASDPARPFVIESGDARIRVLGTSFNVKAYPGSGITEVVVNSGTVLFYHVDKNDNMLGKLILRKGEKGTFNSFTRKLSKLLNNDLNFMSWKTGILVFNETSLDKVLQVVGKKYGITFHISDPELSRLKLTATFDNESLGSVLEVLRLVHKLQFSNNGKDYLVRHSAG